MLNILKRVGLPIYSIDFSNAQSTDVLFKWKYDQQWGWVDFDLKECFVFDPTSQQFQMMKKRGV